jgi:spore coat protein U-like protein
MAAPPLAGFNGSHLVVRDDWISRKPAADCDGMRLFETEGGIRMLKVLTRAAMLALVGVTAASPALTATATGSMNVKITITNECLVVSATDLDFGTTGVIDTDIDQTSTITVRCTNGTPYSVGLGVGNGSGATTAVRKMTGPAAATVDYSIFRDTGRTQVWGTAAGEIVSGTGTGADQPLTAFGRVPAQTTPAAGDYTDIVAITVTY